MKILLAHVEHNPEVSRWYRAIAAAAPKGLQVETFCITTSPPGPRLSWRELDRRWLRRDSCLIGMYRRLQEVASRCDVLINYNGANIHPELLEYLPTFKVFCCFDDPESSSDLSQPVAPRYDAAFYGNIASRFQYESWGCKRLAHLPVFVAPSDVPQRERSNELLTRNRNVDVVFCGEKTALRSGRLEMLAAAFPTAVCVGKGWRAGMIEGAALADLYARSRLGWNVHNTTGPINRRLFTLAAYGVVPLCDNKSGLGQLFELGREAVGFDTIPEAIDLTRYYLDHENERREIARGAHARFWRDYHAEALWRRIASQIEEWKLHENARNAKVIRELPGKSFKAIAKLAWNKAEPFARSVVRANRAAREALRRELNRPSRVFDESFYLGFKGKAYRENPEQNGVNKASERLDKNEPLDWPNMLALNWAVTSLIGSARRIVEIGSGTGPFAEYASVDRNRTIHCFEKDDFARGRAIELRSRSNVRYFKFYEDGLETSYDLLVAVDVLEHVSDTQSFLRFCATLAPRAVFTTPNRVALRGPADAGPPPYPPHVREYDPGEFYWVLRQYYRAVYLYHMPNYYVPWLEPMTIDAGGHPVIAECVEPLAEIQGGRGAAGTDPVAERISRCTSRF